MTGIVTFVILYLITNFSEDATECPVLRHGMLHPMEEFSTECQGCCDICCSILLVLEELCQLLLWVLCQY